MKQQKQAKNYFGLVDDHSSSMASLARVAVNDSNANIESIRTATSREGLDTIVYRNDFASSVTRAIVNSNPHVLKPVTHWEADGMTALYDAIGDMIEQLEKTPDANEPHVTFLIMATTDGGENVSRDWTATSLSRKIQELQKTERWTFVLRVPKGHRTNPKITVLGIPDGNIQEWETTVAGMEKSTAQTAAAVDTFVALRASGKRATGGFFADTSKVNLAQLDDVSKDFKLYVSGDHAEDTDGMMISSFILKRRMQYLKGAAFYQLVKTESKVGPEKQVLIQERTTGKVYAGQQARDMLNIPRGQNARLHPGSLMGYNVFIQSTSWNRKVPIGTGVLYNEKFGVPFTQEEIDRFTLPADPKRVAPAVPAASKLPEVNNTSGKPVHSTMPKTQVQEVFYASRLDARLDKKHNGADYTDLGPTAPKGKRFKQTKRPKQAA